MKTVQIGIDHHRQLSTLFLLLPELRQGRPVERGCRHRRRRRFAIVLLRQRLLAFGQAGRRKGLIECRDVEARGKPQRIPFRWNPPGRTRRVGRILRPDRRSSTPGTPNPTKGIPKATRGTPASCGSDPAILGAGQLLASLRNLSASSSSGKTCASVEAFQLSDPNLTALPVINVSEIKATVPGFRAEESPKRRCGSSAWRPPTEETDAAARPPKAKAGPCQASKSLLFQQGIAARP